MTSLGKPGGRTWRANLGSILRRIVPRLSTFYGIVIRMYHADHGPAHFHARYGGAKARIAIRDGRLLDGQLPPSALRLVRKWARLHRPELQAAWKLALAHRMPNAIAPLE